MGRSGSYRALLVAAILGPALLFAAMAWWSRERVDQEVSGDIARTVDLLHEHVSRLIEVDRLVLDRMQDAVSALTWPEIAAREGQLHDFLASLSAQVEGVDAAFILDAEGEPRVFSRYFPAANRPEASQVNAADRSYFRQAMSTGEIVIDGPMQGRVSGRAGIVVARRLPGRAGSIQGVAVVVISQSYLANAWKGVTQMGDTVSLVRQDGVVLARYPELAVAPGQKLPQFSAATMERLRHSDSGQVTSVSAIDGVTRRDGYRKLDGFPIHIVYAVDERNVAAQWHPIVGAFGALAVAAAASLFLTALVVVRRAAGEAAALASAEAAAAALHESEALHRARYDQTPAPLHAFDRDSNIVAVSERWLELLGYQRHEVIGRPLRDFMTPESGRAVTGEEWQRFLSHGRLRDVQRQYVRKDGEVLDILLSSRVDRDAAGNFLHGLSVLVDVTEQRRMAAALHQAQKMEAVGQMTGGIAHDFNNLLTVIIGNLDIAESSEACPPVVRRRLSTAQKAAQRGGILTQQLLTFARRQILQPEVVDPNSLITEFLPLIRQAAGEAIEVRLLLSPTLARCFLDRAHFEAAVLNLVVNARDAMAGRGTIAISSGNIAAGDSLPDLPPGRYVLIEIADTGRGMPPDVLERAFEPFFTTKEVGRGSGLGLSMVYGFMTQTGGHVRIQSAVGVGTTIRLYLPRAPEQHDEATIASAAGEEVPGGSESVLLVEDDADLCEVAQHVLEQLGYSVTAANDAPGALAVLREARPVDLLFSDVVMPGGMSGDQLAREALRLRPEIKILLTTGYAAQLARNGPPGAGFPMISKPYRRTELAAKLREVLESAGAALSEAG